MKLDIPVAFLATDDPERTKSFYADTLGLQLIADEPFAMDFKTGSVLLRIQKIEKVSAAPYTAFGWRVEDIHSVVKKLRAKSVHFEIYPNFGQDEHGVWTTPSGALVAWFKDPTGNLLSLMQRP